MEFVVQGNVVEIRNGIEVQHGPGEMVMATREVSHCWENRRNAPPESLSLKLLIERNPDGYADWRKNLALKGLRV